jgi:hypothetical protein
MPDVFANITAAPPQALEMISNVLELRASIPQQQEMLRTYLRDIDFPERAKVLEVGCGTGAITRVLATWPRVAEVVGVDPPHPADTRSRAGRSPGRGVSCPAARWLAGRLRRRLLDGHHLDG